MKELEQVIESTIINNVEIDLLAYHGLDYDSVKAASNYIAQEIKDIAWASYREANTVFKLDEEESCRAEFEEWFTEFITNRYKKS